VDIRQLRYFIAIVQEGSFSAAAVKVGVAQPSLSQHIKTLEDRLGSELLTRTPKGVVATDAGQTLYSHAKSILASIHIAEEEIRLASEEPYGKVSFGLPSSVSMVLSVPLAKRVLKEMPYDVESLRHMHTQSLLTEELFFFASPNTWPLKSKPGQPVPLATLAQCPLVMPSLDHGLRALVERSVKANGTSLNVVLEMDSLSQIKSMVSHGGIATILAPASVYDSVQNGTLVGSPIIDPGITRSVYFVRNPARISTRASRYSDAI